MNRIVVALATLVFATASMAQEEAPRQNGTPSSPATDKSPSADGRSANAILAELKAAEMPALDPAKRSDRAAIAEYIKKRSEVLARRAELIEELWRADPANGQLPALMKERWMTLASRTQGRPDKAVDDEIERILAASPNGELKTEALCMKAMLVVRAQNTGFAAKLEAIEKFTDHAGSDPRGAQLLFMAAQSGASKDQAEAYKKLIEKYPDNQFAAMARGSLKRLESVGKPFELEFTEAIKNTSVSMKALRGKVVVIDFWATWCGPCVAEMPKMKDLYARYRDKGVEFIGVSLDQPEDQGGLEKLKTFVAKNELAWPQYYQGKGWESDFSRSWGINSIPCVFVVDQKGNLFSVEARGKLDKMIPELLGESQAEALSGAEASPSRAVATPAKDVSRFDRWDYDKDESGRKGYFVKEDGGRWAEYKDGKVNARFDEVKRTPDFIELKDPSRSMVLRLYASEILWKSVDQEQWNRLFAAEGKAR